MGRYLRVYGIALFVLPLALHAGMIVSGNFDIGCTGNNAPDWTATNIDGSGGCRTTGGNPTGSFILNDNGSVGTDPTISQSVAGLSLGQTYSITLDYRMEFATSGSLTNAAGAQIDGQLFQFNLFNDSTWRTFTTTFVYGGGSNVLVLTGERNGSDNAPRVDNVDINLLTQGVPEPSTFTLFGLSAGFFALVRRIRR